MQDCPRCGDWHWGDRCRCRQFEVAILECDVQRRYDREQRRWSDEIDAIDWRDIYAKEPDDAARLAVERSDQDACEGISNVQHVLVRWWDGDLRHRLFVVYGEMVPEYHATEGDRFELAETRTADTVLQHLGLGYLPDELRPHTPLGSDYYSPERIAEREQRKRENAEWERKRREREQAGG